MSKSKEKKRAQNLHSENAKMCSNPDCNWPECADGESSNRYIIQEITVIGDKPSKVCPVVTDTVNERVLVIERDDTDEKLNKIIDILTAPMAEVVLQMVKSEENIGKVSRNEQNAEIAASQDEKGSEKVDNASKEGGIDEVKDQIVDRIASKLKVISHKGIETTRISEGDNKKVEIPLKSSVLLDTLDKTHEQNEEDDVKPDAVKLKDDGKTSDISSVFIFKSKQEKPKIEDKPKDGKAQSDINIDDTKAQTFGEQKLIPPIQVLPLPVKVEEKIKDSGSQQADPCNPNVYELRSTISSDANKVAEPKGALTEFDISKAVEDIPEGAIKQWRTYLKKQSPDKIESNVDVKPTDLEVKTKEKPVDVLKPTTELKTDQQQTEKKTKDTSNEPVEIEKKEIDDQFKETVTKSSTLPGQLTLEKKAEDVAEPKLEENQAQEVKTKPEENPEMEKTKSKNKPKRSKKNKNKDKLLDISTKSDLMPEATNVNVASAEPEEEKVKVEEVFKDMPVCIDENEPKVLEKPIEQASKSETGKSDDKPMDVISKAKENLTELLKADEKPMDAVPVSQTTDTKTKLAPADFDEPKPKEEEKTKNIIPYFEPKDDVKPDLRETRIPLDISAKVATKREHEKSIEKCKEVTTTPAKIEESELKREEKSMDPAIELSNSPVLTEMELKRVVITKSDDSKPKIEANVSDSATKPAVKSKLDEEKMVEASETVEKPNEAKPEIDDEKQGQTSGQEDDEDIHTIVYNIMERVDKLFAKNF